MDKLEKRTDFERSPKNVENLSYIQFWSAVCFVDKNNFCFS